MQRQESKGAIMDNKLYNIEIRTHTVIRECDRKTQITMMKPDLVDVIADTKTIAYHMLSETPLTLLVVDVVIFDAKGSHLYEYAVGERYSWGESH